MQIEEVRVAVGKQMGLSRTVSLYPGTLDAETRIKLLDYTNAFIAANPSLFTADQVRRAQAMVDAWGTNTPLQDTSFDWSALASEMGANALEAGEAVAGVGKGVLSTLKLTSWLLPLAVVVVVAIFLFGFFKKQTR